ncbi:hypothetical protein JD969_04000 [Planctomycetota bacterium]|nr:hypothetical protein JD969_04000 [Planctomycetota bacterium]
MREEFIDIWKNLPSTLLEAAKNIDAQDVSQVMRLRKKFNAEQVRAAIELTKARHKAQSKFPDIADRIFADTHAIEMASSMIVARHKSLRFMSKNNIWDLCCGIGGDMLALSEIADQVVGYELDALRAWMCQLNTKRTVKVCDVTQQDFRDGIFHIDPARRDTGGKRKWRFDDIIPGPDFITQLVANNNGGCIKLAPSINQDDLPFEAELEYISENNRLVQGLAWTGELNQNQRTATVIQNKQIHTLHGNPNTLFHDRLSDEQQYLYTIDPAIERANLIPELASRLSATIIHEKLGLLTSNQQLTSPFIKGFKLIEQMGWKENRIKKWLEEHNAGIVEIKTRGKIINPDIIQNKLRGKGNQTYTLFILRKNKRILTYITKRI